jgi:hypothetical protein
MLITKLMIRTGHYCRPTLPLGNAPRSIGPEQRNETTVGLFREV